MYEEFYRLKCKPFSLLPDPSFMYLGKQHRMAFTLLQYAVLNQSGFVVVTGQIGIGKTTLVTHLVDQLDDSVTLGLMNNTHPSFGSLMQLVMGAFNLKDNCKGDGERLALFKRYADFKYKEDRRLLLVVDEAQNLGLDYLEQLRLLSNMNVGEEQKLQIILVGQPEFATMMQNPRLKQVAQRIAADYHIKCLEQSDALEYINHRLIRAGGLSSLISEKAKLAIANASQGIPRLINNIGDMCFVYGFGESEPQIGVDIVMNVLRDRANLGIIPVSSSQGSYKDVQAVPA